MPEEGFDNLLRWWRRERELTQDALGARVGISTSYLSKLERGDRPPSLGIARRLADCLGLRGDDRTIFLAAAHEARQAHRDGAEARPPKASARVPPLPRLDEPPVGRAADLQTVRAALHEGRRVINVTGDPAIGKTTLAKALAHELFGQGRTVLWGDAREGEAKTPEEIEALLWRSLVGDQPPPDREERFARLRQAIVRRDPVIFLDNLESAPDFDAVLDYIAGIAPPATVVCTSRRQVPATLGHNVRLYELAPEAGFALFQQVGARHGRQVASAEESTIVRLICEDLLQGHPGAIEIAAALWRSWPLREILRGLRDKAMGTLVDPLRTDVNRSMRLSMDLSYDLLAQECEPAWRLFPRLSVFAASFGLRAIEAICEVDAPLPSLDCLVNRSLLRFDRERYSLHSVVREYGAEKLGEERSYYERRGALYFLDYAAQHAADFDALEEEKGNLFAVMDWCEQEQEQEMSLRFVDLLHTFMDRRGHWEERLRRTERALQIAELLEDRGEVARLSFVLGNTYRNRGELGKARRCFEHGLALSDGRDKIAQATAYCLLSELAYQEEDLTTARQAGQQAATLMREAGLDDMLPFTYSLLSAADKRAGRLGSAYWYAWRELKAARQSGDPDLVSVALRDLFEVALDAARYDRAKDHLEAYRAFVAETQDRHREGQLHLLRAMLAFEQQAWSEARDHFLAALPVVRRHGSPTEVVVILEGLAEVSKRMGDLKAAEGYLLRYVAEVAELGNVPMTVSALQRLAGLQEELGKPEAARASYQRALKLLGEFDREDDAAAPPDGPEASDGNGS